MPGTPLSLEEQVKRSHARMGLLSDISPESCRKTLFQLFEETYQVDPLPDKIPNMLDMGTRYPHKIALTECSKHEGCLLYRGRI